MNIAEAIQDDIRDRVNTRILFDLHDFEERHFTFTALT